MHITLIAAVAENGTIGKDGDLPWRLPADMLQFRERTIGHPVIMGRKTWESLRKGALKKRLNIVVTGQSDFVAEGAHVVSSWADALTVAMASAATETFVIGGASLYAIALPQATRLVITHVRAEVDGDVSFVDVDYADWTEAERVEHAADDKHAFDFSVVVYER